VQSAVIAEKSDILKKWLKQIFITGITKEIQYIDVI